MLDNIFYQMVDDGYSRWSIHSRVHTKCGDILLQVPHFVTDGRRLVKTLGPSLSELVGTNSNQWFSNSEPPQPNDGFRIKRSNNRSRFQSFVEHLLEHLGGSESDSIAIAVDLAQNLPSGLDLKNSVAFPLFLKSELVDLCRQEMGKWKKTITEAALLEFSHYDRIGSLLPKLSKNKRLQLYEQFPLHRASTVISYFGEVSRLAQRVAKNINLLDFAVSADRGPKKIAVGYSNDSNTTFNLTETGRPFDWNCEKIFFSTENEEN